MSLETPSPAPPVTRNYFGWLVLALMFGMVIYSAVHASLKEDDPNHALGQDSQLRTLMSTSHMADSQLGSIVNLGESSVGSQLQALEKDLAPNRQKDNLSQALYVAIRYELKEPIRPSDLSRLVNGKKESTRAFAKIYGSDKLTKADADRLVPKLPKDGPYVFQLAKEHAYRKAGDIEDAKKQQIHADPAKLLLILLIFLGVLGGFALSWFIYIACRMSGELKPKGLLNAGMSLFDADRFAIRGAQLFAIFLFISEAVGVVFKRSESPMNMLISGALMLVSVGILFRFPISGEPLTLKKLGVDPAKLGTHILWGVLAFTAELPLAGLMGVVGTKLFSFLPAPNHPATQELVGSHDLLTVFSILFFGAMVAPFWEEIMFRGLLFPALTKLGNGNHIFGALLSSFIFASIHPQGISLWFALATVGGMSCFLSVQTKSLVPSIVMHALHNATLMVATLLIS